MDKKTFYVTKGYSELDYSQRKEVRDFMDDFDAKEYKERKPLMESLAKSLGPVSSICPCCGR